MVDSTIPYEVMTHLQTIDARLDALEAIGGISSAGVDLSQTEETTEETTEEETPEEPKTRSARRS